MAVVIFLAVLFVLILVHEWGHFIVAKKTGMRVDEFGIGFPPKLFGIKKGETEYTFNALPIGGFVKILGEDGVEVTNVTSTPVDHEVVDGRYERSETGRGGVNASVAADRGGQDAVGTAESGDYKRSFVAKSRWAQAAVLVAGVTMNVLFAWVLFVAVFMIGVPAAVDETEAGAGARLVVTEILPDSPAANAEIPIGAEIVRVTTEGENLINPTPSSFAEFVKNEGAVATNLTYKIGDQEFETSITPAVGVIEGSEQPAVGVALSMIETKQESLFGALSSATTRTFELLVAITVGITTLLVDAVSFSADMSSVAGPVGIVNLVGDAAQFGLTSLMVFTAVISLNLAVINMLPIPALDGGRLLFVAVEAVLRRPINPIWMARVNLAGFALLMILMIAVTYNDILRLL